MILIPHVEELSSKNNDRVLATALQHHFGFDRRVQMAASDFGASDFKGMICPLLTRFGVEHSSPEALSLAKTQMVEFLRWGMDPRTQLPYHAYELQPDGDPVPGGQIGWGRGTGWLATGLAGMLQFLPHEDPDFPRLRKAFIELTESFLRYQLPNGCWGWALTIGDAEDDTSATGMLVWAMGTAYEAGLYPEEWKPQVEAAMKSGMAGLLHHTRHDGEVGQSMADAAGIGRYPWLFGHTSWTQGFALLASRSLPGSSQP